MRGLYGLKPWYTRRLAGIVAWARRKGISPDAFTVAGVVAAALAAITLWWGWWPLAFVMLALRLAGANLDGAVARDRDVARPWGFVLNEFGDRVSDLLMFAGLWALDQRLMMPAAGTPHGWTSYVPLSTDTTGEFLVFGTSHAAWIILAALAATLPTFVSLSAAGAGATRRNGGPFGKTERCLVAVVACALPQWMLGWMLLMVVGSVATAITRAVGTHSELTGRGAAA